MAQIWQYKVPLELLTTKNIPSGPFDPFLEWSHSYDVYFMNIRGDSSLKKSGSLIIQSAPESDQIRQTVDYTAKLFDDQTHISALCRDDVLISPLSWTLSFTNEFSDLTAFQKAGHVKDQTLFYEDQAVGAVGEQYSSEYSLFDCIQRLGAKGNTEAYRFDLLESMDIVRHEQVLKYRGRVEVQTMRRVVNAYVYLHYGQDAMIPTLYYLDEQFRLFLVISTRRTLILVNESK